MKRRRDQLRRKNGSVLVGGVIYDEARERSGGASGMNSARPGT